MTENDKTLPAQADPVSLCWYCVLPDGHEGPCLPRDRAAVPLAHVDPWTKLTQERDEARRMVEERSTAFAMYPELLARVTKQDAQLASVKALIAAWRETVQAIGPHLEGAAFEQCANDLQALIEPTKANGHPKGGR